MIDLETDFYLGGAGCPTPSPSSLQSLFPCVGKLPRVPVDASGSDQPAGIALEADTPVTAGKRSVGDTGTPEEAAAGSLCPC